MNVLDNKTQTVAEWEAQYRATADAGDALMAALDQTRASFDAYRAGLVDATAETFGLGISQDWLDQTAASLRDLTAATIATSSELSMYDPEIIAKALDDLSKNTDAQDSKCPACGRSKGRC